MAWRVWIYPQLVLEQERRAPSAPHCRLYDHLSPLIYAPRLDRNEQAGLQEAEVEDKCIVKGESIFSNLGSFPNRCFVSSHATFASLIHADRLSYQTTYIFASHVTPHAIANPANTIGSSRLTTRTRRPLSHPYAPQADSEPARKANPQHADSAVRFQSCSTPTHSSRHWFFVAAYSVLSRRRLV